MQKLKFIHNIKKHKNIFASLGINGSIALFPILLIPFYISKIGIENFGLISVSFALINYLGCILDYGWYWLGPLNIIKCENKKDKISLYISTVILSKISLFIITFLALMLVSFTFDIFQKYNIIFVLSTLFYFACKSQNTQWIFMGLDKLSDYFFIIFSIKSIAIIIIIFSINNKEDYIYINFFLGLSELLTFAISYVIVFYIYKYRFVKVSFAEILTELKMGYKTFLTNLALTAMLNTNILIISFFSKNNALAGIYSIVEKIINLSKFGFLVLIQSIYPSACNYFVKNNREYKIFYRKIVGSFFLLGLFTSLFIFMFPEFLLSFFSKTYISGTKELLKAMCLIPLFSSLTQNHSNNFIINDKKNIYSTINLIGLAVNIGLILILLEPLNLYAAAISSSIAEISMLLIFLYFTFNNKDLNFYKL